MQQRGRSEIEEFGTGVLQSNWRLSCTLALPLSQTTRSSFCQCRHLCPHRRPEENVVAAMRLEPPKRTLSQAQRGCILSDCGGRSGEPS